MKNIEFAENAENRCPIILLLDNSGSMDGDKIKELMKGVKQFKEETEKDNQACLSVEVCVISFGREVKKVVDFTTIDNMKFSSLEADGGTPLAEALVLALNELEARKNEYKENQIAYYRPWLLVLTDGEPNNFERCLQVAEKLKAEEERGGVITYMIGVGDDANFEKLNELTTFPVHKLKGLNFTELFEWLSASVKQVSTSAVGETLELPPTNWGTELN